MDGRHADPTGHDAGLIERQPRTGGVHPTRCGLPRGKKAENAKHRRPGTRGVTHAAVLGFKIPGTPAMENGNSRQSAFTDGGARMPEKVQHYKFGGGQKTPGQSVPKRSGGESVFIHEKSLQPPATLEQVVEVWWHRVCGTSPGMPKYMKPAWSDVTQGLAVSRPMLKFRPGAKPVLPAGIKRIEDIEGYESE